MKAPLRIGDVWILLGPQTEVTITGLQPRPTRQKPQAQAVTLSDGRTIAESTLRYAYMRRQEYQVWLVGHAARIRLAFADYFEPRQVCEVIPFPKASARAQR